MANAFSLIVKLTSHLTRKAFHLTNIYGPSSQPKKTAFISWLYSFNTDNIEDWLLAGDFYLICAPTDRNKQR